MKSSILNPGMVKEFFHHGIWRIELKKTKGAKYFFVKYIRILVLALKRFNEDVCKLRVSALTFYSLLSIVPVLAMIFGIAKGFGMEAVLEKQLMEKMQGQEAVLTQIIGFANAMLEKTKGGVVAGVGVLLLFWTVIKVLSNVEVALNNIWYVDKPRTLSRKLSDYLMFMLICPVLFIMSSSATVLVSTHIENIMKLISLSGVWSKVIMSALSILPYAVLWFLFSFLYKFMPNTDVKPMSALFAGIVAGTVYQLLQIFYIKFQVGVASYNAIYGSFAALPLFLVWLSVSWSVVILGAQVAYAHQNIEDYDGVQDTDKLDSASRRLAAVSITYLAVKNFQAGLKPLSAKEIAMKLGLSMSIVKNVLPELVLSGILICTVSGGYHPARDIDSLTLRYILDSLNHLGIGDAMPQDNEIVCRINQYILSMEKAADSGGANTLLKNI